METQSITIKESAAKIRKALRSRFGTRGQRGTGKVSVRLGTGTARSWIHVDITLQLPHYGWTQTELRDKERNASEEARKIIAGMKERGEIRLGSYYGDMDNEPNDELLIQVNHR